MQQQLDLVRQKFLKGIPLASWQQIDTQRARQAQFYIISEESYQKIKEYFQHGGEKPTDLNHLIVEIYRKVNILDDVDLIRNLSFEQYAQTKKKVRVMDSETNKYIKQEFPEYIQIMRKLISVERNTENVYEVQLYPQKIVLEFVNATQCQQQNQRQKAKSKGPYIARNQPPINDTLRLFYFKNQLSSHFQERIASKMSEKQGKQGVNMDDLELRLYVFNKALFQYWSFWKSIEFFMNNVDIEMCEDEQQRKFYESNLKDKMNDNFLTEYFPGKLFEGKQTVDQNLLVLKEFPQKIIVEFKTKSGEKWVFPPRQNSQSQFKRCSYCLMKLQVQQLLQCTSCGKKRKFCCRSCYFQGIQSHNRGKCTNKIVVNSDYRPYQNQPQQQFKTIKKHTTPIQEEKITKNKNIKMDEKDKKIKKDEKIFNTNKKYQTTQNSYSFKKKQFLQIEKDFKKKPKLKDRGLANIGNSCYINASLQCLAKIKDFIEPLTSMKRMDDSFSSSMVNLFEQLVFSNQTIHIDINMMSFYKEIISVKIPLFDGYKQHDAHEFITFFLQSMHSELNTKKDKIKQQKSEIMYFTNEQDQSKSQWKSFLDFNSSPITDNFYGQIKSQTLCPGCSSKSLRFTQFNSVTLTIPISQQEKNTVQVFLEFFNFKKKTLNITINCNSNNPRQICDFINTKDLDVKSQNLKIFMLGWEGPVCEIEEDDTLQDLRLQKNSSLYSEEKQLFIIEAPFQKPKTTIFFKFMKEIDMKTFSFKKPIFFEKEGAKITGRDLFQAVGQYFLSLINMYSKSQNVKQNMSQQFFLNPQELFSLLIKEKGKAQTVMSVVFDESFQVVNNSDQKIGEMLTNFKGEIWIVLKNATQIKFPEIYKILTNKIVNFVYFDKKSKIVKIEEDYSYQYLNDLLLTQFRKEEKLVRGNQWNCPQCITKFRAKQKTQISLTPKYLIIAIKRFKFNASDQKSSKNDTKIMFFLQLQLETSVKQTHLYRLISFITHEGSLDGGHYISYAENEGKWFKFNDEKVTQVQIDEIISSDEEMKKVYVLFYQRIEKMS